MIRYRLLCMAAVLALTLTPALYGCGADNAPDRRIIFTTGFRADEVFRVEDLTCSSSELSVILVNNANAYAQSLGDGFLDQTVDGQPLSDVLKNAALSQLVEITTMQLMARDEGIELTEDEEARAAEAARVYHSSLSSGDLTAMQDADEDTIAALYRKKALADKLYAHIIRDVSPEVSDDEARTITVEQIVIYQNAHENALSLAEQISNRLNSGERFETLMATYNEAEEDTLTFGQGETEGVYEQAAFALNTGETSGIITLHDSYAILKCISNYDREETQNNKAAILERRRREAFSSRYDAFALTAPAQLNDAVLSKISLDRTSDSATTSFFGVYESYFGESFLNNP